MVGHLAAWSRSDMIEKLTGLPDPITGFQWYRYGREYRRGVEGYDEEGGYGKGGAGQGY